MMDLTSVSLGAASGVTQSYAALGPTVLAAGQDPAPATVTDESQVSTQAQFSMEVLKKTLDLQASAGTQLAQLIGPGSGVDMLA
jgi:hypothetical protein